MPPRNDGPPHHSLAWRCTPRWCRSWGLTWRGNVAPQLLRSSGSIHPPQEFLIVEFPIAVGISCCKGHLDVSLGHSERAQHTIQFSPGNDAISIAVPLSEPGQDLFLEIRIVLL